MSTVTTTGADNTTGRNRASESRRPRCRPSAIAWITLGPGGTGVFENFVIPDYGVGLGQTIYFKVTDTSTETTNATPFAVLPAAMPQHRLSLGLSL